MHITNLFCTFALPKTREHELKARLMKNTSRDQITLSLTIKKFLLSMSNDLLVSGKAVPASTKSTLVIEEFLMEYYC